jgi:hypothetical protein
MNIVKCKAGGTEPKAIETGKCPASQGLEVLFCENTPATTTLHRLCTKLNSRNFTSANMAPESRWRVKARRM